MPLPTAPSARTPKELLGRGRVHMASNRGPVTFQPDSSGALVATRGAGGVVTALTQVGRALDGTWVAAAMSAGDREMVHRRGERFEMRIGLDPIRLRYLAVDPATYDRYYNGVSSSILWFLHHRMWHLRADSGPDPLAPRSWTAYQAVNRRFADALAEEIDRSGPAAVMLHDYHLMLASGYLRALAPDVVCSHFTHIPWAPPQGVRVLPGAIIEEMLEGMLPNDLLAFQTPRWAANFLHCCHELRGAVVDPEDGVVEHKGPRTAVAAYPISVDAEHLRELVATAESSRHADWLVRVTAGRRLILRVDRMEPSKNIVGGLRAYETLLCTGPEWRGRVVHLALLYPSRQALAEYRAYEAEVLALGRRINAEFGSDGWQPIVLRNDNNYVRALTCLGRYDVLVVNPLADGMNLVSKEGAVLNRNDGVLLLSRNAGSWNELGEAALGVDPHDAAATAEALHAALTMSPQARRTRARALRDTVEQSPPYRWLHRQLDHLYRLRGPSARSLAAVT
ncbi:MAG: alpha,alpha-trehalose-phosphate synthase (UDP-forming) [Actinomycetota bacterium]